jgi:hypothetical protein
VRRSSVSSRKSSRRAVFTFSAWLVPMYVCWRPPP